MTFTAIEKSKIAQFEILTTELKRYFLYLLKLNGKSSDKLNILELMLKNIIYDWII